MIAAVPAAPLIPIGAMLSVGLLALAAAFVLMGLLKGYNATLGALLREIAEGVRGVRWIGGTIADAVESIDEQVRDTIGRGVLATEAAAARFFHGVAWIWEETVNATIDLARSTVDAIEGLRGGEIPRQVTERTQPIAGEIGRVDRRSRARERAISRQVDAGIDRLQRDLQAEKLARERGIDAIDARIDARVAGIEARVGDAVAGVRSWAGARLGAIDARVAGVTGMLAAGALTAAAVRALDLRFPWYKCSNVRRFNRALCRGDAGLLSGLAALGALSVVAVDPRAVARTGQEVVEIMGELLSELADL